MKKYFLILLVLCVSIFSCKEGGTNEFDESPYVILISFDGFRHDYVEMYDAPNFKEFISQGSSAKAMIPAYPSKTFPNHYTMVTGLYPGNHGLVDNTFFDPTRESIYRISDRTKVEDPYYYGGLPLWQLVQQNNMKSASYFWVGSEAPVAGSFPDYYEIYNDDVPNEHRINAVEDWLQLPKEDRPRFITLYFSFIDSQGHDTGPESVEIGEAVLEADRLLGVLMSKLEALPLNVNVILTSDHGMHKLENTAETFVFTDDLFEGFDMSKVRLINSGTHAHLFVEDEALKEDIYQAVKSKESHFAIYKKEETPERWHYRNSDRVGDLFIVIEPGHHLTTRERLTERPETRSEWGNHGFDPFASEQLGAIFYANGPNINVGIQLEPFENVHVYPFIAEILGITPPASIDGQLEVLQSLIKE